MIQNLGDAADLTLHVEASLCVIGGGIAGLLTATEASRSGRRVVVIESGERKPQPSLDVLNEVEQDEPVYRTAVSGRVRSLGGTSTTWGGRMLPLTSHDMSARSYVGLPGWPIGKDELDRHLPALETLFRLDHSSYEATPRRAGLPAGHADIAPRWSKWPVFRRRNVAHVLRRTLGQASNLDVWLGATVCDFNLDEASGRLRSVVARNLAGGRLTVTANRFVIACGTLDTTRLLLLLDLAGRGRVFAACDVLGRHFHDHLALEVGRLRVTDPRAVNLAFGYLVGGSTRRSLHLETTPAAQRADRAASGFVTVRSEYHTRSVQAYARTLGKATQGGRWRDAIPRFETVWDARALLPSAYWRVRHGQMYFGPNVDLYLDARIEQVPSPQSRLTLAERRDPFGVPQLRMEWRKGADDDHTFRSVLRRARRFWAATSLDRVGSIDWDKAVNEAGPRPFERARDTRHPAGTARMGTDRRASVVDPDLRCHAVPNVSVVSAAVFPSSGSANPTLTIMQLAMRAGAELAAP